MSSRNTLVIDKGNSVVKVAEFIDSHIQTPVRFSHDEFRLADVLVQGKPWIFSSVAEHSEAERKYVELNHGLWFDQSTPVPIAIDYKTPESLGVDRIANSCAVVSNLKFKDALVIDIGSCVTYDLVLGSTLRGGAISPGLSMRFKAMNNFTGKLPLTSFEAKAVWPGNDTISCLQIGAFSGLVSEIDGFIAMAKLQSNNLEVVITGGDSPHFASALKCSIFADPNLTLKGLHEILLFNSK